MDSIIFCTLLDSCKRKMTIKELDHTKHPYSIYFELVFPILLNNCLITNHLKTDFNWIKHFCILQCLHFLQFIFLPCFNVDCCDPIRTLASQCKPRSPEKEIKIRKVAVRGPFTLRANSHQMGIFITHAVWRKCCITFTSFQNRYILIQIHKRNDQLRIQNTRGLGFKSNLVPTPWSIHLNE